MTGSIAGEAFTINMHDIDRTADRVAEEANSRGVSVIVLGYPKNMNGSIGERAEKSELFAGLLRERTQAEVILWDERLTSVDANAILDMNGRRGRERKQRVDAVAASLILQSYLDSKNAR